MNAKLLAFLDDLSMNLTGDQIEYIRECFTHGEEGIGLEGLCVSLCEADSVLDREKAVALQNFCHEYGVGKDYWGLVVPDVHPP